MVQQCQSQVEIKTLQTTSPPFRHAVRLPALNSERLKTAKAIVEKTVKLHKVFSIQGPYPVIRASLRARGWLEKRMCHPGLHMSSRPVKEARLNDAGDSDGEDDDVNQEQDPAGLYNLMSRMVRNEMVYFYWTNKRDAINTSILQKEQMTNHFAKAGSFTTKVGLCVNLRSLHWFDSTDPDTFFPRCYRLGARDEKHAFIEDYRRTACTSLLKYIVETAHNVQEEKKNEHMQKSSEPVMVSKMIGTALKVCWDFLESLEHADIDASSETTPSLAKEEWGEFINSYYLLVHAGAKIEISNHLVRRCKSMLQRLADVSPQLDTDGIHNIWIIKPGAKSRGRGIKCAKRLDQILSLVDSDSALIKESKWVVQKYLERPFLVEGTKFDVRQWFLVTDWNPLTVWFYKKCYLRFSTQPYSLDTLDNSVHLCNNSIQKHLRPSHQRHPSIPEDNMWSADQFITFLSGRGYKTQWENVVVPGMKKSIIHALQSAQDLVDSRKNTFELYGADFMLGGDFHPWLIEINASPTMAPSTPITARLCAAVQEDTLRVVLDRRANKSADTGDFELIYHQAGVDIPQYVGVNLFIEGFRLNGTCLLPPLRPFKRSVPKYHGTKKEIASEKVKSLPKVVKSANTPVKNISNRILPPPVPQPSVPIPLETFTLQLPKTAHISVHLPVDACSHSVSLWRRGL
ncbi:tubulin monoglycylase TTLL3-like isoform X1 [Syngnathus acus]|uniref:tubulin monoglycylase TTLL3-like isoform X1 n=2 Tax=Syngnathus acus TaxID=161584 RepID=UPI001885C975|nr:tubulin monoglycylase TTLL3-like isoform X1 [Syngnathus acus]XP_037108719.1 tubulin monoglycylase TTLL3-like isoform X1 [Syngnathus acus]XP_037108721.1 tubulin monoglycylase TTLL3-like isoform X1 [Syngnathus acus]XP_037108722.1 tubulin monoglycylase TTLL3-like isoform X1 [Syngnathus acus]